MIFETFDHDVPLQDPSDLSVSVALAALRRNAGAQVSNEAWERVRTELPHLRRFIESASFQLAPNNPNTRGAFSAALVSIVDLLQKADSQQVIDERWAGIVEGLSPDSYVAPATSQTDPRATN